MQAFAPPCTAGRFTSFGRDLSARPRECQLQCLNAMESLCGNSLTRKIPFTAQKSLLNRATITCDGAWHGGRLGNLVAGFKGTGRLPAHKTPCKSSWLLCTTSATALEPFLSVFAFRTSAAMSGKGAKGLSGSGKGAKGTMGDKKGDKKKPVSRSARAGLQFPVGRIHRLLKVHKLSARSKAVKSNC